MAISIDWVNRIIMIPRADMLLVQSNPTEIRELDLVNFHTTLRLLEAEYMGILFMPTHNYKGPLSVGGVTLAAVVEVINNYTILFEDGQYAVNLVNANSNAGDRVNVNQVSVRSANSAGLTNVREIQFSSFQGVIALDTTYGVSGTAFPTGTHAQPSNNLVDATFIADLRGVEVMIVHGMFTLNSGDNLHGRTFKGENAITTAMVIDAGAIVANAQLEDMFIYNSTMSGTTYIKHASIANTYGLSGYIESSMLAQNIGLDNRGHSYFVDCKSACVGLGTTDLPIINMANGVHNVAFRNFSGPLKFTNSTNAGNTICLDVTSGSTVTIDASCTAGTITVRGVATIVNNGTMTIKQDTMMDNTTVAEKIWNHAKAGTKGDIYAAAFAK